MDNSNIHGEPLNREQNQAEIDFWLRWSAARPDIEDGIEKLEAFGLTEIRFLQGDFANGDDGYQLIAKVEKDRQEIKSPACSTPVEALRETMLWLYGKIQAKQIDDPTKRSGVILGPDGQPL